MEGAGDSGQECQGRSSEICICPCGDPCACICLSIHTAATSTSTEYPYDPKSRPKKADYDKAKAILSKPSAFTCDDVFSHLYEVIQRVIDERPDNIVDYFENYSRYVRCGKFKESEWLAKEDYREPQFLNSAAYVLNVLKLPYQTDEDEKAAAQEENETVEGETILSLLSSEAPVPKIRLGASYSENVLQILHLWYFCGLGFQIDEMFQLSLAVNKIQTYKGIESARFWGRIYGSVRSYYIVEATLTRVESKIRLEALKMDLVDRMIDHIRRRNKANKPKPEHPVFIPGYFWRFLPDKAGDLERMQPQAVPTPYFVLLEKFDMPPEPVGSGLNRRTYFVTTSFREAWTELPIVTPEQIRASRKIRRYFTGFLDEPVISYPPFPGCEKNYLRAVIARITAGTYIAPKGYYRKMTKSERRLLLGQLPEDMEGEFEEEGLSEGEEDICDNDCPTIIDKTYEPLGMRNLRDTACWEHSRPYILDQGRVLYIDERQVVKEIEKKALRRMKLLAQMRQQEEEGLEEEEEEETPEQFEGEDEGEEEFLKEEIIPEPEIGPELFTPCSDDNNSEEVCPWTSKASALYSINNRMVLMRSNLWPGAFSFSSEKISDSLYFGWGAKYLARSMTLPPLPPINDDGHPYDLMEATDPTPEMEEKWRLYYMKKEKLPAEEMSMISVEYSVDDNVETD